MSETPIHAELAAAQASRARFPVPSGRPARHEWEPEPPTSEVNTMGEHDERPEAPDPATGGHPPGWPAAADAADPDSLEVGLPAPGQVEQYLDASAAPAPSDELGAPLADPNGFGELRRMVGELDGWLRERGY